MRGAAAAKREPDAGRREGGLRRQHLPVRDLSTRLRGRARGGAEDEGRGLAMPGWKKAEENRILGKSYARLDGPIKVTGRAKYAYDINLPGLLYGRIFRSQK